jgi:carbon monoxide dehydrogenase subunit G
MDLTGRYAIPAPPNSVWGALNDAEILAACIPGRETVEAPA